MRTITVKLWAPVCGDWIEYLEAYPTRRHAEQSARNFGRLDGSYRILPVTITCEVPEDE